MNENYIKRKRIMNLIHRCFFLAILVIVISIITSCGGSPEETSIPLLTTPNVNVLEHEQTVIISVDSIWETARLQWKISSDELFMPGELSSDTDSTVVYQAPPYGSGTVEISVIGFTNELIGSAKVSLDINKSSEPSGLISFTCFIEDNDDICTIDANGRNEKRLTSQKFTDYFSSISPDGQEIFYSSLQPDGFKGYRMDMNGENKQQLPFNPNDTYAPAMSPDKSQIAFVHHYEEQQNIRLFDVDSGIVSNITDSGIAVSPTWSPDGRHIAYTSGAFNSVARYEIYIFDLANSATRQLDIPIKSIGGSIDWSPDGKRIVFYAGMDENRDIFFVSLDTLDIHQVTNGGNNIAPTFSPDGNWVAFASKRDGDLEIFISDLNGRKVNQITFNERADWQPDWGISNTKK